MIHRIFYIILFFPVTIWAQINTDRVMAIGRNALYFEDYVLSIQYFNQVIGAKPYLAEPYFYRGLAKLNLDDFQGAEADCTESIQRNPFVVNAYQMRGFARIQQDNYKGAIQDYNKALTIDPENVSVRYNLALCYYKEDSYKEAKNELDTLLRISPRYTDAYLMRMEVNLKQKDTLQAVKDVEFAVDIDRYNPNTWTAKPYFLCRRKNIKRLKVI